MTRFKITTVFYILAFLSSCLVVAIHLGIENKQNTDGVRINLAGRQRMLAQKLSTEILQYSGNGIQREILDQTCLVFKVTLQGLIHGGKVPLDWDFEEILELTPTSEHSTQSQLLKISELWSHLSLSLKEYVSTKEPLMLQQIFQQNQEVIHEMDKAVFMMQKTAESHNRRINTLMYSTYFLVFSILIFLFGRKIFQMKHASHYINQLESILPICAKCKKIREPEMDSNKQTSWTAIEEYIQHRSKSMFSHSMCPKCLEDFYGKEEWFLRRKKNP